MKQTLNINETELLTLLMGIEKSTFVHLVTETTLDMNKKGNPYFDKIIKRSSCNFLCGNDYETRVQKNYEKEGMNPETFVVEPPTGKTHISKCVLENTNKNNGNIFYFMVERFDEIKPKVEYIYEGNPIDKTLFESFMKKVYESKKQEQDRKVQPITYKVSNIKEITLNGTHYIIER